MEKVRAIKLMLDPLQVTRVPVGRIDLRDRLTDFSLDPVPEPLRTSIREIGPTHPLILARQGADYRIVCGHRRARAAADLNLSTLPAWVPGPMEDADRLALNLAENFAHRQYSDVETGLLLEKFFRAGVEEDRIITQYMPLARLERSKKLYEDFRRVADLPPGLQNLLHELNIPARVYSTLYRWDDDSRLAAETVFSVLRPGVGKWRDLLERIGETAKRDGLSPADLLQRAEILTPLRASNLSTHEKYGRISRTLFQWRYPTLSELRKKVCLALDQLKLGDRTRIRTAENFETGEIKIEMKFTSQEQLADEAEKLSSAAGSDAMRELIRIFRELG